MVLVTIFTSTRTINLNVEFKTNPFKICEEGLQRTYKTSQKQQSEGQLLQGCAFQNTTLCKIKYRHIKPRQCCCTVGLEPQGAAVFAVNSAGCTVLKSHPAAHCSQSTLGLCVCGLGGRITGFGPFGLWGLADWISGRRRTFCRDKSEDVQ